MSSDLLIVISVQYKYMYITYRTIEYCIMRTFFGQLYTVHSCIISLTTSLLSVCRAVDSIAIETVLNTE